MQQHTSQPICAAAARPPKQQPVLKLQHMMRTQHSAYAHLHQRHAMGAWETKDRYQEGKALASIPSAG
eukprot:245216-Pelagomonas_calceolata.AAC.4